MSPKTHYSNPLYRVMLGNLIKVIVDFNECKNVTKNTRAVDCSGTLADKIINELEFLGIISVNKSGREVFITFTDRGDDLRRHLRGVRNIIEEAANDDR